MATEMRVFLETRQGREVIEKQTKKKIELVEDSAYFDRFCSVTSDFLIIKRFFIPSELPYNLEWNKIRTLSYIPQSIDRSKSRRKGMDLDGVWWALDSLRTSEREKMLYNIRIETDCEPPMAGFSVLDVKRFLETVRPRLSFNCKISGCFSKEQYNI